QDETNTLLIKRSSYPPALVKLGLLVSVMLPFKSCSFGALHSARATCPERNTTAAVPVQVECPTPQRILNIWKRRCSLVARAPSLNGGMDAAHVFCRTEREECTLIHAMGRMPPLPKQRACGHEQQKHCPVPQCLSPACMHALARAYAV
ncbi:unnamed protein product, partial [Ectocarpus sp. 13 AM-2016]